MSDFCWPIASADRACPPAGGQTKTAESHVFDAYLYILEIQYLIHGKE